MVRRRQWPQPRLHLDPVSRTGRNPVRLTYVTVDRVTVTPEHPDACDLPVDLLANYNYPNGELLQPLTVS
jgi:hypothetical protein